jgi:hypothetical protein
LRPVGLAKLERMVLVGKSLDRKQLKIGANGAGEGSEDGMEIREASSIEASEPRESGEDGVASQEVP